MERISTLWRLGLVLTLLLVPGTDADAAEPYRIGSELPTTSIASYATFLEDPQSDFTLEDVRSMPADRFAPVLEPGLSIGHTQSTWWVKVSIENAQDEEAALVVRSGNVRVDEIQAHLLWPDGSHELRMLGDLVHPADRILPSRVPILELTLPARTSIDVLYRVRTQSSLRFPISIASKRVHLLQAVADDYRVALLHGAIGGLMLLNLFFYFSLREKACLWYSICSAGMIIYMLGTEGFGPFLVPNLPLWDPPGPVLIGALTSAAMAMFARSYLGTSGKLDRILQIEIGLTILACFGVVVTDIDPRSAPSTTTSVISVLTALSLPVAAGIRARQGAIEGWFFLFAWSFLIFNAFILALDIAGFAIGNLLVLGRTAVFVERVGSALGLAHRVYTIRTERTEAQAVAAAEQARYRRLIEHSPLGVAVVNRELAVTHINFALGAMLEIDDLESLEGMSLNEPLPNLSPEMIQTMKSCIADEEVSVLERTWTGPRGQALDLRIHYSPVPNAEGEVMGCQMLVEDITLERSLRDQLHQAQKLEGLARLAGGVAHDFNNYLTAILGFSEILLKRQADSTTTDTDDSLEMIHDAAKRSANVTRQLLAFSRKQPVQPRVLEIGSVVSGMANLLERMVGEDVSLEIHTESSDLRVRMDATQLEQVLVNLVVNARDAMRHGGRIRINVAASPATTSEVVLAVEDTGEGMDAETQSQIFDPFFTTKEVGVGTGLGLATVHGVVQQSGGRIDVDSKPGQGTTFLIHLPRVEEQTLPETAATPRKEGGSARVLVVDDNESVRILVRRVLEDAGYKVDDACNGPDALARFANANVELDLLITDVVMPEMSGVTLRKRLAEHFRGLPVLYISGYTARQELEEIERAGDPLLTKPFTPTQLTTRVQRALRGM